MYIGKELYESRRFVLIIIHAGELPDFHILTSEKHVYDYFPAQCFENDLFRWRDPMTSLDFGRSLASGKITFNAGREA